MLSVDGKIGLMEDENRLVVVDYPHVLALIRGTVEQLDVPRAQVRITALIYDLSIEDLTRLGINWSQAGKWRHDASGEPQGLFSIDSLMQAPAAAGDPSSVITLMNLSRHFDITGVIDALAKLNNARLLADPSVTVVDREEARIQIVTEIPFQQLTQTQQGGNIGTTSFREAGVSLDVRPHIACDGTVQLNVTPMFSRLAGFTSGATPQPIIDKRQANTTVRVASGQTLVIGGLRQRTDIRDRRGVPFLKDMKHFGHLFRAKENTVQESELVVFITPEIVTPVYSGTPREVKSLIKSRQVLERIPAAPDLELHCAPVFPGHTMRGVVIESAPTMHAPIHAPSPPPVANSQIPVPQSVAPEVVIPEEFLPLESAPDPRELYVPEPPESRDVPSANSRSAARHSRWSNRPLLYRTPAVETNFQGTWR